MIEPDLEKVSENIDNLSERFKIDKDLLWEWFDGVDQIKNTKDCLGLCEIKMLPKIREEMLHHIKNCEFCQEIIEMFDGIND